ncbi:MAG: ABC transporter ATP-binding protein/permease [Bacilli bacterium]|nr:ABC transporter ATP-binding protein/permease [Bacilli bacterium]
MESKKRYWKYVKENRASITMLTILVSLLALVSVAFAYISKLLIDSIGEDKKFISLAIVLAGLILLEVLMSLFLNVLFNKKQVKLENNIKKTTFLSIINNDYLTLDNKDNADYLNRIISDSKVIADGVITYLPSFISLVLRIVFSFITLLVIDWIFALVLLGIGILTYLLSTFIRPISKRLHKASQHEEGLVLGAYKSHLNQSFLIKLFDVKHKVECDIDSIQDKYMNAKVRQRNFSTFINTSFRFFMRLAYIGAIIYVGTLMGMNSTVVGFGSMLAMIQLISQIEGPFTSLSSLLPRYYQSLGSIERVEECLKSDETTPIKEVELNDIHAESITFKYEEKEIFSNLSFDIKLNDFTFIKGRSGAGKTTLLKCIMGAYKLSSGELKMGNEDISLATNKFAYVPQTNFLVKGSILDNLLIFSNDSKRINEVLSIVCLDEKIASLPNGVNTILSDDGTGLSIGEGQRLNIARAILSNRPILVLDECTSALDNVTGQTILNNLKKLNLTIILVSHKLEHLELANNIIDLSKEEE